MRFNFLLITVSFLFCRQGFAQISDRQNHETMADQVNINSLMISFDYATNTNVMGNFNAITKQPSLSPSLTYFSKWGADASALLYFVDNSDDSLENWAAELDLILGCTFKPTNHLTVYPSYSHFFHSSNSNSLKSMFSDDIRLDVDYNYKFFNIGISAGYYMGHQNAFYTSVHNYYDITFDRFLFHKASLSMQPGVDANFGSYEYLNIYYLNELRKDPLFYFYLLSYPAIRRYVMAEMYRHPGMTKEEILDDYLQDKAQDSFKLTSVSINLPVYYMIGNFGINLGLYFIIPVGQPDYMSDETQFFFDIGVTYNFMFEGK
jgi:hypothetical protein